MCKFLRNFIVPILSKIEITIDTSMGLKTNFILEVLKNRMVNLVGQTSSHYSYDHCQTICTIIYYIQSCGYSNLKVIYSLKKCMKPQSAGRIKDSHYIAVLQ